MKKLEERRKGYRQRKTGKKKRSRRRKKWKGKRIVRRNETGGDREGRVKGSEWRESTKGKRKESQFGEGKILFLNITFPLALPPRLSTWICTTISLRSKRDRDRQRDRGTGNALVISSR